MTIGVLLKAGGAFLALNSVAAAQIVGALPEEEPAAQEAAAQHESAEAMAPPAVEAPTETLTTEAADPEAADGPAPLVETDTPTAAPAEIAPGLTQASESQAVTAEAEPETEEATEEEPVNEDEIADKLNSMQQLQQSVTLTRSINGEVAESEKRTITYSRGAPVRATEAGVSEVEALKAAFDQAVLTRPEALEEAKLDFILADKNRDGAMNIEEFVSLVETWRENSKRFVEAPTDDVARDRQYDAFLREIDPDAAKNEAAAKARKKFAFMAGAAQTLSQKEYIAEYLVDFDAMDENSDTFLKAEELLQFRAANRGDTMRPAAVDEDAAVTPASALEIEQ